MLKKPLRNVIFGGGVIQYFRLLLWIMEKRLPPVDSYLLYGIARTRVVVAASFSAAVQFLLGLHLVLSR